MVIRYNPYSFIEMNPAKMIVFKIEDKDFGKRLDVYLAENAGISRSRAKRAIDDGFAVDPSGKAYKPSHPLEAGDVVTFYAPEVEMPYIIPENIPLDIIYSDAYLVVLNKPAGIVVHPGRGNFTGTLASGLLYHYKNIENIGESLRPGIVHRLDKETSGLIIAALTPESHTALSEMMKNHEVKRVYTAFVWGCPNPMNGTIDAPLGRNKVRATLQAVIPGGKYALTRYETEAVYTFLSKLKVRLETGRTHQIRVHMTHIGHPVFGDASYGGREKMMKGFEPSVRDKAKNLLKNLGRQALHAGHIEFTHPFTGEKLSFDSPLPEDLDILEKSLY